jgi:hypothetical protein
MPPGRSGEKVAGALTRRRLLRTGLLAGTGALAAPLLQFGRCRLLASGSVTLSTRALDLALGATVIDMLGLLTLDGQLRGWLGEPGRARPTTGRTSSVHVLHPRSTARPRRPLAACPGLTAGTGCSERWLLWSASIPPRYGGRARAAGRRGDRVSGLRALPTRADVRPARLGQRVSAHPQRAQPAGSGCTCAATAASPTSAARSSPR